MNVLKYCGVFAVLALGANAVIEERSLAIIFDGTGSMGPDLKQLKDAAKTIVNKLSMEKKNHIGEYILVVFRDPDIEKPFVTKNPDELLAALDEIKVSGGDDCPENSLAGLEAALKLAKPNSFAFLYTDADAKDYALAHKVIELITAKQIKLDTTITDKCDKRFSDLGKNVYHNLSKYGRGQVLEIEKNDVSKVMVSYIPTLHVDYSPILEAHYDDEKYNSFFVDNTMSKVILRITGRNPTIVVKDPHNKPAEIRMIINLPNLKVIEVTSPEKGKYSVHTKADTPYSLKVEAASKIHFKHGFGNTSASDTAKLSRHIIEGSENVITIDVDNPESVKELTFIAIVARNRDGTEYRIKYPMRKVSDKVYQSQPIDLPATSFEIFLEGVDKDGDNFERFIVPVMKKEEPTFESKFYEVIDGSILRIPCGSGNPSDRFKKSWIYNGKVIASENTKLDKDLELELNNVTKANAGKYLCKLENADDTSTTAFNIRVVIRPSVVLISNIKELKIGSECTLKCNYQSNKQVNLTWSDEKGNVLSTNNQIYTFKVPKSIKSKQLTCNVTTEDYSVTTTVSFKPPPKPVVECYVEASREWLEVGPLSTCKAKEFTDDAVTPVFVNGRPTSKITGFSLSSGKIKKFPTNLNKIFDTKLVALECSDTRISEIHSADLKPYGLELQYLDLCDNNIMTLEKNLFQHNKNLRVIQMSGNNIANIDGNVFDELVNTKKLVYATMSDNKCIDYNAEAKGEVKELAKLVKGECNAKYIKWDKCKP